MDRQLLIKLSDPQTMAGNVRKYLAPMSFTERETAVLVTIICHGQRSERAGQKIVTLQAKKASLKPLSGISGTTWLAGARDLCERGIVGIVEVLTPWVYVLNLDRLAKLEAPPPDPFEGLDVLSNDWQPGQARSGPVSPGQPLRDSVRVENPKVRVPCTVIRERDTQALTGVDRPHWARPWDREAGCTDEQLVSAVTGGDLAALRELYTAAVRLGWIQDCDDSKLRFLTVAHHAATCAGLHGRMAVLVARTKRALDVDKIRAQSEDWAASMLRRRNRDPELARQREGIGA
jgi:hypothetical protein